MLTDSCHVCIIMTLILTCTTHRCDRNQGHKMSCLLLVHTGGARIIWSAGPKHMHFAAKHIGTNFTQAIQSSLTIVLARGHRQPLWLSRQTTFSEFPVSLSREI